MMKKLPIIFCLIFILTQLAIAEEMVPPGEQGDDPDAHLGTESTFWIDQAQKKWSGDITNLAVYIDSLMGDISAIQDSNKSYLKLYLGFNASKYNNIEPEAQARFSLDLPITKKRLRLVLESDLIQGDNLGENEVGQLPANQDQDSDDIYASFRYLFKSDLWQRLSFDWGVKAKWTPDLFSRARGVRSWQLSDRWSMRFSQELYWFESKGVGTRTTFDFDHPVIDTYLLRLTSATDWYQREGRLDFLKQLSVFHNISERRAVQHSFGVNVERQNSHTFVTNYVLKTTYRRRLYKEWLYYQLSSGFDFSREESFNADPFIYFRIEVLFSESAGRRLRTRLD